jgi:hypothetical protein
MKSCLAGYVHVNVPDCEITYTAGTAWKALMTLNYFSNLRAPTLLRKIRKDLPTCTGSFDRLRFASLINESEHRASLGNQL